jgi:hypothetical protein
MCVTGMLAACSSNPLAQAGGPEAAQASQLVATPARDPGSAAGCQAPPAKSTPQASADKAVRLQAALDEVRSETFFGPVGFFKPADPQAAFDEAWTLVAKAKALDAAKQSKAPVPDASKPDPVEQVLLPLLPWASQTGLKPDAQLQQRLLTIVNDARGLIDDITHSKAEQNGLNALLPPGAKPPELITARAGSNVPLKAIEITKTRDVFGKLTDLASFRAFHLLALLSAAQIHETLNGKEAVSVEALETQVRLFNVARYLSAYFDAYFRGGQFIQFNVDESAFVSALSSNIAGKIQTGMTAAQIQKLIQPSFDDLCKSVSTKSGACGPQLGSTAFVTRSGLSVQFAGISYTLSDKSGVGLSHSYPQVSQFGPQMLRIFVEAIFDANGQHLKGAPNSTACQPAQALFNPSTECLNASAPADDKLNQIDMLASGAEALATTGTGVLVRGYAMASTNNELLAQMLETLAGVNARKITEKVLYLTSYGAACPIVPVSVRVDTGHSGEGKPAPATTTAAQ